MSDRRLPLPGEQPSSIWQPRRRRASPRARIPWLAMALAGVLIAIAAGTWLWASSGTPVTVVINGQPISLKTHSTQVSGAVWAAGVRPDQTVYVMPGPDTALRAGMTISVGRMLPVIVHADGQTRLVDASSTSPQAIVAAAGITLGPDDSIRLDRALRPSSDDIAANPALANVPVLPREISVVRATTIIVTEGGEQVSFKTTALTLGQALHRAGYVLYEADQITPPLETMITPGQMEVSIVPAVPVSVKADGQDWLTRTHQTTVGALLGELGLVPNAGDYVIPSTGAPIASGMSIRLIRTQDATQEQRTSIPYQTTFVPDPDMELDQQREIQPGKEGTRVRRVTIHMEDGTEVSRTVTGEWVEEEPQARVVAYGTKIVIRILQTAEGNLKYWRKLRVLATSYSPSNASDKKPGDPRYGLSGTGAPVRRGVVAVDTRVISLGTQLYVPGYGVGTALDVGGAVKGLRVDLGYEDPLPKFWNDWTDLYLLLPVPPPDQIIWVIPAFTPPEGP